MGSHRVLLTAGSNAKGQLGIGSYDDAHTFTPCQFSGYPPNHLPDPACTVTHVACGANHTVLLLRHPDGSTTLWGTGDGEMGQLGVGYPREGLGLGRGPGPHLDRAPVPWTRFHPLVLDPDPAPHPHPHPHASPEPGGPYARDLRGYRCTQVAAAWETTYVVLARLGGSDVVLSMGSGAFGALGVGDAEADVGDGDGVPRVVAFDHVFAGGDDGAEAEVGRPGPGAGRCVTVRALQAGPRHVVAQLVVTTRTRSTDAGADADAGGSSARITPTRNVLVGWGASRHGQLGQNGGARFVARPMPLPIDVDDDPMVSCALGNQHTVVLHASGRISALGSNKRGQMPSVGGWRRVCQLGCTWNGTYMQAIEGDKHVLLSVGSNAQGQLGRDCTVESGSTVEGTVTLPADRALSSFVCGSEHILAAMSNASQESKSVVGWGWNEHGNMGLGSVGNITLPTQLWPREDVEAYNKYPQRVIDIWAGCATSWLLVE